MLRVLTINPFALALSDTLASVAALGTPGRVMACLRGLGETFVSTGRQERATKLPI
jgi:hypothetical protein